MKILDALRKYNNFNYFDMFFEQTEIRNQRTGKTRSFDGIYRLYYETIQDGENLVCELFKGEIAEKPPTILPIVVKEWTFEDGGDVEREVINFIGVQGIKIEGEAGQFDTTWFEKQPKRYPTTGEESLARIVATSALYHHRETILERLEFLAKYHEDDNDYLMEAQRTIDYLRYGTP